ncbi:CLUMA_CG003582, isoform A [Clunio marinus]|uniref:CLUMA_CG003582, isoform A n=1 Tax=Clunio marinus TaxID=568069 RepID=A0A1J1HR12_9DIPT|nr:CLUMA_CG003582, isoform A [Clunio marinus]
MMEKFPLCADDTQDEAVLRKLVEEGKEKSSGVKQSRNVHQNDIRKATWIKATDKMNIMLLIIRNNSHLNRSWMGNC